MKTKVSEIKEENNAFEPRISKTNEKLSRSVNTKLIMRAMYSDGANPETATQTQSDANERDARTAVGGQLSLAGEQKGRREPARLPAGGGGGEEEAVVVC